MEEVPGMKGFSHLVGTEGEDAIQILHELLEGGSLGGDGVPAVFHHHVPERGAITMRSFKPKTE